VEVDKDFRSSPAEANASWIMYLKTEIGRLFVKYRDNVNRIETQDLYSNLMEFYIETIIFYTEEENRKINRIFKQVKDDLYLFFTMPKFRVPHITDFELAQVIFDQLEDVWKTINDSKKFKEWVWGMKDRASA